MMLVITGTGTKFKRELGIGYSSECLLRKELRKCVTSISENGKEFGRCGTSRLEN